MRRRAADLFAAEEVGRRLPVSPARDEIASLGTTLNAMLARIERAFERERSFTADASHELRTPLSILKAEVDLALEGERSRDELEAALRSASEETDRLTRLAEDLLVLARADEGRLPVRPETIDAGDLLATIARRFELRATHEGRELSVAPSDGLVVHADRLRAEQALGNLVDNALRHGSGTVELSACMAGAGVRLHVGDRGPGLDPALDGRAFERFTRGDRARSRGGTGLGLAIVDAIARSHGGAAGADPRPGGGADVWIELPSSHAGFMGEG
jgi:signal transduction histidine kinase